MLTIRFQRVGKKGQPSYRVVVAEKRSKLQGPPVEDLGSYSPFTKKAAVSGERVLHWLKAGAKPSPTVHNLLVREKIIEAPKVRIQVKKKLEEKAGVAAPAAAEAAPRAGEQTEATPS